jgi:hypothetical protein
LRRIEAEGSEEEGSGEAVTMVPGTIFILSLDARAWYLERKDWTFAAAACSAKEGSFGTQPVRWYSGRTAREAP